MHIPRALAQLYSEPDLHFVSSDWRRSRGRIDTRGSSVSQCLLISHVVLCGMSMAK